MKEMVGGCCVCSDERGWPENPLVYCDGQNCTVAVHQACYGIVTVPTGPWFCRKCESQERSARVRCELCPSRDGALKKTDNQGWAHVVCALYIPEVRFGNVTTMEPIILQLIPQERYSKTCYICQEIGKGSKAHVGACMQCNKSGCKQQFHVTCAQALGLLCEEAGNYLDNVKYCGYCQHHYSKLKKGGNVKTIPPYKPVTNEAGSSDPPSSPEKESETLPSSHHNTASTSASLKSVSQPSAIIQSSASTSSKQRKSGGSSKASSSTNVTAGSSSATAGSTGSTGTVIASAQPSTIPTSSIKVSLINLKEKDGKHGKSVHKVTNSSKGHDKDSSKSGKSSKASSKDSAEHTGSSSGGVNLASSSLIISNMKDMNATAKETLGQKFTTSNFTETVVVNSESVFGSDNLKATSAVPTMTVAKKRKADGSKSTSANSSTEDINKDLIKDVSVTLVPLSMDRTDTMGDEKTMKKQKTDTVVAPVVASTTTPVSTAHSNVTEPNLQNVSPNVPAQLQKQQTASAVSSMKQQVITQTSMQLPHVKLSANEVRLQSSPAYNASSTAVASSSSSASTMSTAMPSLVVSVPLSNANVPVTVLNASTNRSSPATVNNAQPPNHTTERRSPLIISNSTLSPQIPSNVINAPNLGVLRTSSPVPSSSSSGAGQDDGLKITFEKQPNSRVAQLQEESTAVGRRSRSHSTDTKTRNGKKRSAAPSTSPSPPVTFTTIPDSNSIANNTTSNSASNGTPPVGTTNKTKPMHKKARTQSIETPPSSTSRTPDTSAMAFNNSFSGLKFSYEAQSAPPVAAPTAPVPSASTPQSIAIKDSPPSSPNSEGGSRKPNTPSTGEAKDFKIFQNGVHVTHMLGNQLNPASSVAQKMSDQLHMELEANSMYTSSSLDSASQFVGPPFPGKAQAQARNAQAQAPAPSLTSMLGGNGQPTASGNTPRSLEQLLERQWEQGSQFLMEQAQHFDIASLLSCLHQLKTENVRLEDHVTNLIARRDHLLAVNARLAIPLTSLPHAQAPFNNMHMNGPTEQPPQNPTRSGRPSSHGFQQQQQQQHQQQQQQQMPVENGIDFRHNSHQSTASSISKVKIDEKTAK
ncbi:protein AF-10-like isoform X2 [Bradysia coprophila]|uniref:protein AF-10-like isoform X2 n=1 Tax=Bradysia coprophila TaxID=38358 RepID=UPI00187D9245|nr:protein AF-10-like isoform X2 [Bradysia coprophila]